MFKVPNSTNSHYRHTLQMLRLCLLESAKVWIFREPKEISCPVEFTEKPVSVTAPVVVLLLMVLNPPSDLTGPLKVVLPMSISLSWQLSVAPCNCQGY